MIISSERKIVKMRKIVTIKNIMWETQTEPLNQFQCGMVCRLYI